MQSRIIDLRNKKTRVIILEELTPNGVDILEEITADEGMVLTQKGNMDISERVLAHKITLGKGCDSSEWIEITEEKAEEIRKEQKEITEKAFEEFSKQNK